MTSVSYEDVFSYFLGEVTDYEFAALSTSDATQLMSEYLHKTVATPYVNALFSSIELDDRIQTLSYEMDYVVNEQSDKDFVLLILSKGMLIQWLNPQVRSKVNISQFFGGKEANFFSQSSHLSQLKGLLEDTQTEMRNMIRDRGYINNEYLEGK